MDGRVVELLISFMIDGFIGKIPATAAPSHTSFLSIRFPPTTQLHGARLMSTLLVGIYRLYDCAMSRKTNSDAIRDVDRTAVDRINSRTGSKSDNIGQS